MPRGRSGEERGAEQCPWTAFPEWPRASQAQKGAEAEKEESAGPGDMQNTMSTTPWERRPEFSGLSCAQVGGAEGETAAHTPLP